MEFQAVIMAGGRGSQMSELTSSIPKPLLPVGNKPLIWYTVNMLERVGFKEVIIITLNSILTSVRQALSPCKTIIPDIVGISEDADWGTLDSLRHIKDKIKSDLLILSCDLICDFPLYRLADVHRLHDPSITMLFAPTRPDVESIPGVKTKRKQKKDREIVGLSEKDSSRCRVVLLENEADIEDDSISIPRSLLKQQPNIHMRTDLTDVHAYIMKKRLLDYIVSTPRSSLRSELIPYLVRKQWRKPKKLNSIDTPSLLTDPSNTSTDNIDYDPKDIISYLGHDDETERVHDMSLKTKLKDGKLDTFYSSGKTNPLSVHAFVYEDGFCMRINTMTSFVEANRLMAKNVSSIAPNLADYPLVHPTVKIQVKTQVGSDSMVAEESEIGTRVSVKRCVIGKHCVIGNQVKLTNCTILDRVIIKDGCVLQSCVICDNVEIGEKSTIKETLVGSKQAIPEKSTITNELLVESASMMEFD